MYALRVTCAVTPRFRLTHGGPAPARQALRAPADGSHLPPVNEFRTDDSASGFDESGGSKFVMRKVLRIKRVAPVESETEQPLVMFKGYKVADLAGPDRPKCGGSGAHISINMQRFRTGRHNAST
jgi:hypothetical protein